MSEWKSVRLGDVVEITSSKRVKRADYVESGVPFFRSKEVIERSKGNAISTELFITEQQFQLISSKFGAPVEGDILLTSVGTIGVPYQVKSEDRFYFKDGNLTWFRNFEESVAPRFLYYWLTSPIAKRRFDEVTIGSTQKALTIVALKSIEIELPPIEIQNSIVEIVDYLDGKFSNNRQTNQTLESISQAIFKSWFIDFEPTRAKIAARENGQDPERATMAVISARSIGDLDQLCPEQQSRLKTMAALFPDVLVDSELGEIPKGWEIKLNGEVMDVRDGTHDSPKKSETGFPLVTSKHITSGVLELEDAYLISKEDYQRVNKRSQVNQGDILLTMIGTVGIPFLVSQPEVNFAIKNVGLFKTSSAHELSNYFYLLLKSPEMKAYLEARMAGTTQKYLSLKTLRSIEMVVPSKELLESFNEVINPIMEKIFCSHVENKKLSELRDTLLPKLLNGDLSAKSSRRV